MAAEETSPTTGREWYSRSTLLRDRSQRGASIFQADGTD
jgi:hypothetical protein